MMRLGIARGSDLQTIGAFMRRAEDGAAMVALRTAKRPRTGSSAAPSCLAFALELSLGARDSGGRGEAQAQQHGGGDTVEHQFETDNLSHYTHLQSLLTARSNEPLLSRRRLDSVDLIVVKFNPNSDQIREEIFI